MKIVTLIENTSCDACLTAEHGLSFYLETEEYKILYDMGQTDAFARNAEKMGIDLASVDFAVLSHGHYDHGGGLETFLRINSVAPIYIHKSAFGAHYNGTSKYIGLNPVLQKEKRVIFTEGTFSIAPKVRLSDCNHLNWRNDSCGLNRKEGEIFLPDEFHHEQYMEIAEGEKRILLSGCSHKGILNITQHFRPHVLLGGFHLNKQEDTEVLQEIAHNLLATGTQYYTGHCTGSRQFALMKGIMGAQLQSISTGTVIQI